MPRTVRYRDAIDCQADGDNSSNSSSSSKGDMLILPPQRC
jgi:hypothetical protein